MTFGRKLKLEKQPSSLAPEGIWTNTDLDPTPPEQRTWGWVTWWTFWAAAVLDPASWQAGGSMISIGLNWRHAIAIIAVGNIIIGLPIIFNGVIGSRLRVPFPVIARASYGHYFSYFPIVSRLVLAWVWFGVVTYNSGLALTQMLKAMIPAYERIPNHLPESAGITTRDMISYLIFNFIQLPFFFLGPKKLRYFFAFKCIVVPAVALAMMAVTVKQAGAGPLFSQQPTVTGADFSKAWLLGLASTTGNWATLACNVPDFTRYSRSSKAQTMQLPAIPFFGLFIATCGILAASGTQVLYGEALWSPFDILDRWTSRAGVWFCAVGWMIGGIGANISCNSLSAANDLTTLCPKYINLTRGQLITAIIGGWAMVPWKVLASSQSFLAFMSGYSVIMGPIVGIMTADYYFVKKGKYHVPELYDPQGIYRFTSGINWRALVTLLLTVTPLLPGFIQAVSLDEIQVGNVFWFYAPGFISGFIPSMAVYTLINYFAPHRPTLISECVTADDFHLALENEVKQVVDRDVNTSLHSGRETGSPSRLAEPKQV